MTPRTIARVGVTGATGFLGKALIRRLLDEGIAVRALARSPAKLGELAGGIDVVEGDLADGRAISRMSDGVDAVVHAAALTHALSRREFDAANVDGSACVARAAFAAGALLLVISSIAARKPDLSDYAASKAGGEAAVRAAAIAHDRRAGVRSDVETTDARAARWLILRAPALYGPGDEASLPLLRMVKRGLAPEPWTRPSPRASILYIEDMAAAILAALREAPAGEAYDVGDDVERGRTWAEIGAALGEAVGRRPIRLPAPRALLMAQAAAAEAIARRRGKATFVSRGKVREFFHPDWVAGAPALSAATTWSATTPLVEGFAKTLKWYQERGLI